MPSPDHHPPIDRRTLPTNDRRLPVHTVPWENGQLAAQCGRLLAPLRGATPVRSIRGSASREGLAAAIDADPRLSSAIPPGWDGGCRSNKAPGPTADCQSPITDHRSPITDHRSPITDHRLPITDHRSPITDHRLPITDHRLPITDYRLPITDYRLPITDYRLPITLFPSLYMSVIRYRSKESCA